VRCAGTGKDATDSFEDIGHSNAAKKQVEDKCIFKGTLVGAPEKKSRSSAGGSSSGGEGAGIIKIIFPVVVMGVLACLVQKFM